MYTILIDDVIDYVRSKIEIIEYFLNDLDSVTLCNSAEPASEQSDKAFTDNDTEERRVN